MNNFLTRTLYRAAVHLPDVRGKGRLVGLLHRAIGARPEFHVAHGLKMQLDLEEYLQAHLYGFGELEPLTGKLMQKLLKPGDVYVDVGAHVGFHTLLARQKIGNEGVVVAIEPQPENAAAILANWQLNGFSNLDLYVAAAGEQSSRVRLPHQVSRDRARLTLNGNGVNDTDLTFQVPIVDLESVVEPYDHIRLLKIDVEGFELQVLRGARNALERVENIVFEYLRAESGHLVAEICTTLESMGFTLMNINGVPWRSQDALPENNVWACRQVPAQTPGNGWAT